jgi:hypothetical protein
MTSYTITLPSDAKWYESKDYDGNIVLHVHSNMHPKMETISKVTIESVSKRSINDLAEESRGSLRSSTEFKSGSPRRVSMPSMGRNSSSTLSSMSEREFSIDEGQSSPRSQRESPSSRWSSIKASEKQMSPRRASGPASERPTSIRDSQMRMGSSRRSYGSSTRWETTKLESPSRGRSSNGRSNNTERYLLRSSSPNRIESLEEWNDDIPSERPKEYIIERKGDGNTISVSPRSSMR